MARQETVKGRRRSQVVALLGLAFAVGYSLPLLADVQTVTGRGRAEIRGYLSPVPFGWVYSDVDGGSLFVFDPLALLAIRY